MSATDDYDIEFGSGMILKIGDICERCYKRDPERMGRRSQFVSCEGCNTVKYCSPECRDLDKSSHDQLFCRLVGHEIFKKLLEHRFILSVIAYMALEKTPSTVNKLAVISVRGRRNPSDTVKFEIEIFHDKTVELQNKLRKLDAGTSWKEYLEGRMDQYILVEIPLRTKWYGVEFQVKNAVRVIEEFGIQKNRASLLDAINLINSDPDVKILSKNLQKLFRK